MDFLIAVGIAVFSAIGLAKGSKPPRTERIAAANQAFAQDVWNRPCYGKVGEQNCPAGAFDPYTGARK